MRKWIFSTIEVEDDEGFTGRVYDVFMMIVIILSILPLAFKSEIRFFHYSEYVVTGIFLFDYALRWMTADFKLTSVKHKGLPFLLYPFTPMALIDLVSILPTFLVGMNGAFRMFRVTRLLRTFRVLRVFKVIRYSKSISIVLTVLKKQSRSLITVALFAIGYITVSALVMFNVEQRSFKGFFDALYWATVSLTTVGYGDIYPVTTVGRVIAMLSSFFGIAIIALPSGIITAGFMEELKRQKKGQSKKSDKEEDRGEGPADPDDASR